MKYYAQVPPYYTQPKNKLQAAVQEALNEYKRFVFSPKFLPVVKDSITRVIAQLSIEHPRCQAITSSWYLCTPSTTERKLMGKLDDWRLSLSGGVYSHEGLTLKVCREETDL